jgi:L-alanine-DL-glutamate epimerase-like enolase superfamily enzyme
MPLGNVWAWPSQNVSAEQSAAAMRQLLFQLAEAAERLRGSAHPIDHMRTLHDEFVGLAAATAREVDIDEPLPMLAILVAASPIDAALHDGFGKANGINCFNGLSAEYMSYDLAHYLDASFAGEYLDRYTLRQPKHRMPLYHLVGALDPLTDADIAARINDGLPETLGEWIAADGLDHLKIKLNGDNLDWDVDRVAAVEHIAAEAQARRHCEQWFYSLDFNERCSNVEYVLEFLRRVEERVPTALHRVQYIEQPTHRDLKAHPENRMHAAAKIKPVVIDESLVDYESLLLAREQGYSGVALKACKGHTEALLMAAAAQKFGMFLCVQDLTCPGASFLHSAELSARIPGVAAIEGNARQYCPAGNAGWRDRFPTMFKITDGRLGTAVLTGHGLGH